jgi:hypothetical protein
MRHPSYRRYWLRQVGARPSGPQLEVEAAAA